MWCHVDELIWHFLCHMFVCFVDKTNNNIKIKNNNNNNKRFKTKTHLIDKRSNRLTMWFGTFYPCYLIATYCFYIGIWVRCDLTILNEPNTKKKRRRNEPIIINSELSFKPLRQRFSIRKKNSLEIIQPHIIHAL